MLMLMDFPNGKKHKNHSFTHRIKLTKLKFYIICIVRTYTIGNEYKMFVKNKIYVSL